MTNLLRNIEERFTYDRLDRLTGVIEGIDTTGFFTYDDYGRMTTKRLHGAMVFDNTTYGADGRPHALEQARMYKAQPVQDIRYTSFDKTYSIRQQGLFVFDEDNLRFDYGYEHQRLRMTDFLSPQDSIVKEYVGNCEFVKTNGVTTSECTFLSGPLGVFAVLDSHVQPLGKGMYYVHPDHLGSWTTVTNRNGLVVQDVRFDPWGTPYYSDSTRLVEATLLFDRGFTGHEHLMRYGLINMNGRVYDPVTSTFLSVDNYVQDPSSTQNFNRYAYCMNNPLKYTDPDGEWAHLLIGALIGGIVNLATNWSSINTFGEGLAYFGIGAAAGIAGALTGGAAAGAIKLGGFVSGAVSGAAGGASSGLITGSGNAWMQGANFGQGLKAGALAAGIGAGTGALAGGLFQGYIDHKQGYSFWDGTKTISTETVSILPDESPIKPTIQPGDTDCIASTLEWTDNTLGGNMSFDDANSLIIFGENGEKLDLSSVKNYCMNKGYPFDFVKPGTSVSDKFESIYSTIKDGGRVVVNENTGHVTGHAVGVKSVTKTIKLSIKGCEISNYGFNVMDPLYGDYFNISQWSWSIRKAYNIAFILKP